MTEEDRVALERRLTSMEGAIDAGFDGVHRRLDTLNGKVASLTEWRYQHQGAHDTEAAYEAGEEAARVAVSRRTLALLAAGGSVLMVAVTTATQVLVTHGLGG